MKYTEFGLVNTNNMFRDAVANKYAVPAFNFYNMETLTAILAAVREVHSPVILAVSESAMKYMGDEMLMGLILGAKIKPNEQMALHLDHGSSIDACKHAIDLGFSSVMIDASSAPFAQNLEITKSVVDYAHKRGVSIEAELGTLSGIEDENTKSNTTGYTKISDAKKFVNATNVDSLAISIGTSHGAYKRKSDDEELRFDILEGIVKSLPNFPLVLHGASQIPEKLVMKINKYGGAVDNARGIAPEQLRHAIEMNICKINIDSDLRVAMTAAIRKDLTENPSNFNPREYLRQATDLMRDVCIEEIQTIMGSGNRL